MKSEKRKVSRLTSTSEVLENLFRGGNSALSAGFMRWRISLDWPQIVGPMIAEQTEPAGYFKGTMYIKVKHSVWLQQLQFMKAEIRDNVNRYVGKDWAQEIKFSVGDKTVPKWAKKEMDQIFGTKKKRSQKR